MTRPVPGGQQFGNTLRRKKAQQLFKTDMCKFYVQGRCDSGDKCAYAHNPNELRGKPNLEKTSMCRNFAQTGNCVDSRCRFAHDKEELVATHGFFKMKMCGFATSGRCKRGAACRFAHSKNELRPGPARPEKYMEGQDELAAFAEFGLRGMGPIAQLQTSGVAQGAPPYGDLGFGDSPLPSDTEAPPRTHAGEEWSGAGGPHRPLPRGNNVLPRGFEHLQLYGEARGGPRGGSRRPEEQPHGEQRGPWEGGFYPDDFMSQGRQNEHADSTQTFSPPPQQYEPASSPQQYEQYGSFRGQVIQDEDGFPVYAPMVPVAQMPWAGEGEEGSANGMMPYVVLMNWGG